MKKFSLLGVVCCFEKITWNLVLNHKKLFSRNIFKVRNNSSFSYSVVFYHTFVICLTRSVEILLPYFYLKYHKIEISSYLAGGSRLGYSRHGFGPFISVCLWSHCFFWKFDDSFRIANYRWRSLTNWRYLFQNCRRWESHVWREIARLKKTTTHHKNPSYFILEVCM